MLKLTIILSESFNEETNRFIKEEFILELEHSLVSLSKWESEFEKPFLDEYEKTNEEIAAYVRHMILTPEYPDDILSKLSEENAADIRNYIDAKMTGSTVIEPKQTGPSREKITSELIYFWMTSYQIPWEAQYWHLNRLFMLIKIFNAKNQTKEKRKPHEIMAERRALNEQRMRQYGTKG